MAVIDAVDEGIIVVDQHYGITIFNSYCEALFGCAKDTVLGLDIRNLIGQDAPASRLLESGVDYHHLEAVMNSGSGEISYVSTGRVIRDDNGMIIGAVASIKDTNKVRELANIISAGGEDPFKDIIGNSRSLEQIKTTIRTVARSNSTVMLRGESGTGKELFAQAKRAEELCFLMKLKNCRHLSKQSYSVYYKYRKGAFDELEARKKK